MAIDAALAERFRVVGHDDYSGVVHPAALLQPVEQTTEMMIGECYLSVIQVDGRLPEIEPLMLRVRPVRVDGINIGEEWPV